ncbi:MAG: phosphoglycerate kinase [Candidatus Doudnabacteria bacterium]|nr:phosphoglycerate kinase [Candidatus Doudnabacteria bacterium]
MIKSVISVKLGNRRVFVRAGFDVPLKKGAGYRGQGMEWVVADDSRIRDALKTIHYLIDSDAKIILASHLGRPQGWDPDKSLWPVAEKLGELLGMKVVKVLDRLPDYNVAHIYFLTSDITKKNYSELTHKMRSGDILFLENLRFYPGEKNNDQEFVETLASLADVYVDEAFSNAHRSDSSMAGLAKKLPAYAGVSLLKEIASLNKILRNPQKPFVLIIGGAKISGKVETIEFLGDKADHILLGGKIGNTFLKVLGYDVGSSEVEDEKVAKDLLRNYKNKIYLPIDAVVAKSVDGQTRLAKIDKVLKSETIFDIGPETIRNFSSYINSAQTLVWNGPFGFFENPKFAFGSKAIAQVFASVSKGKAFGVVGGGETIEVVNQAKVGQFIDHVSMGGGAMLEFLAGKELPGIKALS